MATSHEPEQQLSRRTLLKLTGLVSLGAGTTALVAGERAGNLGASGYLLNTGMTPWKETPLVLGNNTDGTRLWLHTSTASELDILAGRISVAEGKIVDRETKQVIFDPDRLDPSHHYDVKASRVSPDGRIIILDVSVQEGHTEHVIPAAVGVAGVANKLARQAEPYDATLIVVRPETLDARPDVLELRNGEQVMFDDSGNVVVITKGIRQQVMKETETKKWPTLGGLGTIVTTVTSETRVSGISGQGTFDPPPQLQVDPNVDYTNWAAVKHIVYTVQDGRLAPLTVKTFQVSPLVEEDTKAPTIVEEELLPGANTAVSGDGQYVAFTVHNTTRSFDGSRWIVTQTPYVCIGDTRISIGEDSQLPAARTFKVTVDDFTTTPPPQGDQEAPTSLPEAFAGFISGLLDQAKRAAIGPPEVELVGAGPENSFIVGLKTGVLIPGQNGDTQGSQVSVLALVTPPDNIASTFLQHRYVTLPDGVTVISAEQTDRGVVIKTAAATDKQTPKYLLDISTLKGIQDGSVSGLDAKNKWIVF